MEDPPGEGAAEAGEGLGAHEAITDLHARVQAAPTRTKKESSAGGGVVHIPVLWKREVC
jgi:hypothetical protein